jgi:chaperonin cofactor prefoldin
MVSLFLWSQRLNSLRQQADFSRQELDKVSAEREKARQELARWTNTQKELEELKATAFYPEPGARLINSATICFRYSTNRVCPFHR